MKSLKNALLVLLLCTNSAVFAQNNSRSPLFNNQPERLNCTASNLANAFNASEGQPVTISFSNANSFTGRVISNIVKYSNLQTMTIQLPNYQNAVLHLSKQVNDDRSVSFVGRIMQKDASDGFVIEKMGNDYSFKKMNAEKILEVCH